MRDYRFRGWRINLSRQQLFTPSGMSIPLSYKEFRTLAAFIERPMRILTRDQLLDLVHSTEEPYDRVVDVMVSRLRRKLMLGEGGETLIQTVRGEGYMFASPVVRI